MSSIGPQLPPHLQKRKRDEDSADNSNDDNHSSRSATPEKDTDNHSKRARTIGPSLPPAPLNDRPPSPPTSVSALRNPQPPPSHQQDDETSSEDDDFGPSLPPSTSASHPSNTTTSPLTKSTSQLPQPQANSTEPPKRGTWMTLPPKTSDWSSRQPDPTKLKARKFNSVKPSARQSGSAGGNGGGTGGEGAWDETPEQKQERLRRQVLGGGPELHSASGGSSKSSAKTVPETTLSQRKADEETKQRMQAYAAARGPSLYASHQSHQTSGDAGIEKADDPSARAFDREKDVAGGLQINDTKRREMMKNAANFGNRFGEARYL